MTMVFVERRSAAAAPGAPRIDAALAAMAARATTQPATARASLIDAFAAGPPGAGDDGGRGGQPRGSARRGPRRGRRPRALEIRDRVGTELLEALLTAAPEAVLAKADPLQQEAIAGAIYALSYCCVRERGPEELPRIVPFATYLALAPFIGPKEACTVANGEDRRRPLPVRRSGSAR